MQSVAKVPAQLGLAGQHDEGRQRNHLALHRAEGVAAPDGAEESFADWPVERELRFRDVVHYLIFDEYMRAGQARAGTKTNMGEVVTRIIPEEI